MDPYSYRSTTPRAEDVLNRSRESSHSNGSNHSNSADKQPRLLGWMRNALAGGSRSTSPTPPSAAITTASSGPTLRPDPSATPKPRSDGEISASSSSRSSPVLPSRNLAAEFDRNESRASSFDIDDDGTYSTGHFSISDNGEEGDSDDEELYVPFPAATSSAAASPIPPPPPSAGLPGLVKPTARRSVSLSHGHAAELEAEVQRLTMKDEQNRQERQRQSQNGVPLSASSSSMASDGPQVRPPSLFLTAPDGQEVEELMSPLYAGYDGSQDMTTPTGLDSEGDGGPFEAAKGRRSYVDKAVVAIGSMAAAAASTNQRSAWLNDQEHTGHQTANAQKENWDDSRSKTPKAFSDLQQERPMARRQSNTQPTAAQELAAAVTASANSGSSSAGSQPPHHRSFWSFGQGPAGKEVSASNDTVHSSPSRRRLFGGRRRVDSGSGSFKDRSRGSGEQAGHSVESNDGGAESPRFQGPSLARQISGSLWKFGPRKASTASTSSISSSKHSLSTSESVESGFSVEVPFSETSSIAPSSRSRPSSYIASNRPRSTNASSWGKSTRIKIKAGVGLNGEAGPKKVKSRAKNKSSGGSHFSKLLLAQELYLGIQRPEEMIEQALREGQRSARSSTELSESSQADTFSSQRSSSRSRPLLPHGRSEASIATTTSTVNSSGITHGTVSSTTSKRTATWAAKFSIDGRYLAIAGQDRVIRVFEVLDTPEKREAEVADLKTQEEILRWLSGDNGSSESILIDGLPASAADNSSQRKKKTKDPDVPTTPLPVFSSKPIKEFRGHTSDVLCLDWSKGNFLLSSSMDKSVKIWHLTKQESLIEFRHGDFVTAACFHPRDDRFFLSGSLDGKLRLWNISAKRVQASADVPGLITACTFSASGTTAIAGTFAGACLFYQTEDLVYKSSIAVRSSSGRNSRGRKITGIEAIQNSAAQLPPSPTSLTGIGGRRGSNPSQQHEELIMITSNDSRIRIYSLTDKRLTAKYKGTTYLNRTSQIKASACDETFVTAGSESGEVFIWDWQREPFGKLAALGKRATGSSNSNGAPASRSGASSTIIPSSTPAYESWTAADHARPITVALLAPLKTHVHLMGSKDPIIDTQVSASSKGSATNGTTALTAFGLAGALSAAMPSGIKLNSNSPPANGATGINRAASPAGGIATPAWWDARRHRIAISVDESQIVRVWRAV